jgi:hypothetical protein
MVDIITNNTVEFPYEEWFAARTPQGVLVKIQPVKGSWTLLSGEDRRRMAEKSVNVKGMIACPRCGRAAFIPENFDPPKELGDGKPTHQFMCRQCKFVCNLVLKQWDRRKLYCACYETKRGDSLATHKEYLHAVDDEEAKKFFWLTHGPEVTNLVGIAPVVGFFAEDKTEKKLLVD